MLKTDRQENILEILKRVKRTTSKKLADELYTSYSSIRRDINELEQAGLVIRSYGRVELAETHPMMVAYPIRMEKNSDKKLEIAKKAASLVHEGDTVFIDPSSSCAYFAKEIVNIKGITVITNNIEILYYMTQFNVNVISTGGVQSAQNRYAMIGAIADGSFGNFYADFAFFSARSLTESGKIYDIHYDETVTRKAILKNAAKKVFLCDSSKINTVSPYYQCDLSEVDYLISDGKSALPYAADFPRLEIL